MVCKGNTFTFCRPIYILNSFAYEWFFLLLFIDVSTSMIISCLRISGCESSGSQCVGLLLLPVTHVFIILCMIVYLVVPILYN